MAISRRDLIGAAAATAGLAACVGAGSGDPPTTTTPGAGAGTAAGEVYTLHSDLAYAAPVGRGHLLDLYLPTSGQGPFPVVIYQAGSAFLSDDTKTHGIQEGGSAAPDGLSGTTTAQSLSQRWAPHGYAVVGLNVRGSGQAKFPAPVHDVKAAIRFLRANADRFGLDTTRFATMGTSSGGWVSTMAGVTSGLPELEGDLGNPTQSSAVQAVIDLFGPTDFLQMDEHRIPGGQTHDGADSPESLLMGFPIRRDPAAVAKANPVTYVSRTSPPLWISHGTQDPLVPAHQSELLFQAYGKAGATASLTLVPGVGHTESYLASVDASAGRQVWQTSGGSTSGPTDQPAPTYDTLLAFLDEHLKR